MKKHEILVLPYAELDKDKEHDRSSRWWVAQQEEVGIDDFDGLW